MSEKKETRPRKKKREVQAEENEDDESIFDDNVIVDKLPEDRGKLRDLMGEVERKIKHYKQQFLKEEEAKKSKIKSYFRCKVSCRGRRCPHLC